MRTEAMTIGSVVGLTSKAKANHHCPVGRQNNKTATILNIYGDDKDQVMLDRDLHGCKFWNIKDLYAP